MPNRRILLAGAVSSLAGPALAQIGHEHHAPYESLRQPGRIPLPEMAEGQRVFDSPAPRAANAGRWAPRAALPLPRSEMAWAAEFRGRMHLVGGYGEQRVDRPYHHVYDPARDAWSNLAPLPRGANHVGVAVLGDRLYAVGGFVEQNRTPHAECFAYDAAADRWASVAPLPRACGAIGCVTVGDRLHAVGGAEGSADRRSVNTHLAYDPARDAWETRAPFMTARDHVGVVATGGRIHLLGGRVDTFYTNSHLHHAYDPAADKWEARAPLPTGRSGHGAVLYRGRIVCMGGEGSNRVFGQTEAYDPARDAWEALAPMLTPRHGLGAVTLGDAVHVAGGGPVMGGGVQSAVHEAFTLG